MARRILDTNVLIYHWREFKRRLNRDPTLVEAEELARSLIRAHGTKAIVTPVYVELVAGATSAEQLRRFRAYLDQFDCVDRMTMRQGGLERDDPDRRSSSAGGQTPAAWGLSDTRAGESLEIRRADLGFRISGTLMVAETGILGAAPWRGAEGNRHGDTGQG